ncbi:uncharacterized protein LOC123515887 [Portunus trituberculatus]|uniref:uncharacterized protein LOC123515887 n=1 Tax=Portunus trituberculatus TaxID=210409 RepID=UPI001E1CE81B|nr:uncharacterized protein LOC123515887 [Portunus trituberculatus]
MILESYQHVELFKTGLHEESLLSMTIKKALAAGEYTEFLHLLEKRQWVPTRLVLRSPGPQLNCDSTKSITKPRFRCLEVYWMKLQSVHACGEDIKISENLKYLGSVVRNDGWSSQEVTWTLNTHLKRRIDVFGTRCLRMIMGYCWYDFVSNQRFLLETDSRPITSIDRQRPLRLYGHVARYPEADPAYRVVSERDNPAWRRPKGRPKNSWLR